MPEFVRFNEITPRGIKTQVWEVVNKTHGSILGTIGWNGGWRQYCFFSISNTVWSAGCLDDVASFIRERMAEMRSDARH